MLWKVYVWLFFVINMVSFVVFDYRYFRIIPFFSLVLSAGLNIAVFSYAYKKKILSNQQLIWLFKLNLALIVVFLSFEFITFLQEAVGYAMFSLPTSGVISVIASFPSLPALYATYKMAYSKSPKSGKKSKKKA